MPPKAPAATQMNVYRRWVTSTTPGLRRYDLLGYVSVWIPSVFATYIYAVAAHAHAATAGSWGGFWASLVAGSLGTAGILGKKKKESLDATTKRDYGAGVNDAYNQWRDNAGLLQGGMAQTFRYINARRTENGVAIDGAISQYLLCIATTVREIFGDACGRNISVSMALPDTKQTRLITVKFYAEVPGRNPGRPSGISTWFRWPRR